MDTDERRWGKQLYGGREFGESRGIQGLDTGVYGELTYRPLGILRPQGIPQTRSSESELFEN